MGSRIAEGFVLRGETVLVSDPWAVREWPGSGRRAADIAASSDVHLICVRGEEAAAEVLFGQEGILRHADPASSILLMTTMASTTVSDFAERARQREFERFADAAMSRRSGRIEDRSLTVLLGAADDAAAGAVEVASVFADNVIRVGGIGAGMAAKLVNNWLLQTNRAALLEAMRMALSLGVEQRVALDVFDSSTGASWVSGQWADAEDSLLRGDAVDRALAARTSDELELLRRSLGEVGHRLSTPSAEQLVAAMEGVLHGRS